MSLERLRRQHGLDYKPSMTLVEAKTDKLGKRYIFRLNDDAIFYAIGADEFWKGANVEPAPPAAVVETIPAAPKPKTSAATSLKEQQLLREVHHVPPDAALIRAESLEPGDIITRKTSPTELKVLSVAPAKTPDKTRITYLGFKGKRRSTDAFNGEKFVLIQRKA